MSTNSADPDVQYSWPPRDPGWQPDIASVPRGNPFVYGEDGFNPALQPSNGRMRERARPPRRPQAGGANCLAVAEDEIGGDYGDYGYGSDRSGSDRTGSSPEPYLSDYDDDLPLAYTSSRVRRGSEGWEVRPAPGWATGVGGQDMDTNANANVNAPPPAVPWAGQPWERAGRYNVYDPDDD